MNDPWYAVDGGADGPGTDVAGAPRAGDDVIVVGAATFGEAGTLVEAVVEVTGATAWIVVGWTVVV